MVRGAYRHTSGHWRIEEHDIILQSSNAEVQERETGHIPEPSRAAMWISGWFCHRAEGAWGLNWGSWLTLGPGVKRCALSGAQVSSQLSQPTGKLYWSWMQTRLLRWECYTWRGERECVFRTKLMKAENGNVCNSLEVSSCFSCQKSYNQDHCWVVVHCAVEVVGSAGPPVPDRLLLPVPLDDPIVPWTLSHLMFLSWVGHSSYINSVFCME